MQKYNKKILFKQIGMPKGHLPVDGFSLISTDSPSAHRPAKPIFIKPVFMASMSFGLALAASVLTTTAFAQRASGTLQNEPVIEQLFNDPKQVNDGVTQAASNVGGEIRFLLKPRREAQVSSRMAGVITRIHYKLGQRFKRGATLISMYCGEIDAELAAQKARTEQARLTYQADRELLAGNAVSQFTVAQSKAALDEQNALLEVSNVNKQRCTVKAPFSGGVVSVDANAFEAVSSATQLMAIIDDSGLVMSLNIPSSYVSRVRPKDTFTIAVDETGKSYRARVEGVSPMIDPISKTIELRASIVEGLQELKPGMSGRANLDFARP